MLLVLCDCYVASWFIGGGGVIVVEVLVPYTDFIDVEILYGIPVFLFFVRCSRSCVLYIVSCVL